MKINEVPQDQAFLIEGKVRDVCYAIDENGNYTKVLSKGWNPKNEAIGLAWETIFEHVEDIRQQVLNGKLSPLAFYMELKLMDVQILSGYTGIPKRKVKKHLTPKEFNKLSNDVLNCYANILNISTNELTDLEIIKNYKLTHEA